MYVSVLTEPSSFLSFKRYPIQHEVQIYKRKQAGPTADGCCVAIALTNE